MLSSKNVVLTLMLVASFLTANIAQSKEYQGKDWTLYNFCVIT